MWKCEIFSSKPVNSISDSSTILHCLKSFQIRSYFWSVFGHFLRIENLWRLLAFGFHFHTLYSSYYFIYHHTQMTVYVDFKKNFSLRQDFLMLCCCHVDLSVIHFPRFIFGLINFFKIWRAVSNFCNIFLTRDFSPIYHQQINSWLRLNDLSVTWSQRQIVDLCERRNQWIW